MPKKIIQDVLPPKRSIRNIPIEEIRESIPAEIKKIPVRRKAKIVETSEQSEPVRRRIIDEPITSNSLGRMWVWLLAIVSLFVVIFAVFSMFASASVSISPKKQTLSFNENLTAGKAGNSSPLQYEVIKISKDGSKEARAGADQKVDTKATGTLIIYNNNANNAVQKLIKNTRFETSDGLIFRITDTVTIPARTLKDGEYLPGSKEVNVVADVSGANYNIGLKDFTLPGFKGDPKFTTVFARSKTNMTGGYSGIIKKVADSVLSETKNDIENDLKNTLRTGLLAEVPSEFILYNDSIFFSFEMLPQSGATENTVKINEKGTAYGLMLNKNSLKKAILQKTQFANESDGIDITNMDKLAFALANKNNFSIDKNDSISFSLKGDLDLVWTVDAEKMKQDLVGKPKNSLKTILSSYKSVEGAKVIVKPFWNKSFPGKVEKINITINND